MPVILQSLLLSSEWGYSYPVRANLCNLEVTTMRDFPDHAAFREKSVATGLVRQA